MISYRGTGEPDAVKAACPVLRERWRDRPIERPIRRSASTLQRESDIAWIIENLHVFRPAAQERFTAQGPGAIVIDTTVQPSPDAGHPMYYMPQDQIAQVGDDDVKRMVGAYDPQRELVLVLLKPQEKVSTYRVQLPSEEGPLPP
jgi:hypothetical protein